MLNVRNLFVIIIRKYGGQSLFSKEMLCTDANKLKCIQKMQATAPHTTIKQKSNSFAAVLIPIVQSGNGELSLLYTLRSSNLRKHIRQVSFPGGIRDSCDSSYIDCALRETEEEIGLKRENVTVWGEGKLCYPRNGPAIMPVIGFIENYQSNQLHLNIDEVERVFTVTIEQLCRNKKHTQFRTGNGLSIPVFTCNEERIWGITAIITNLFLHSLLPAELYKSQIKFIPKYKS